MSQKCFNMLVCILLLSGLVGSPPAMPVSPPVPSKASTAYAPDHLVVRLRPEVRLSAGSLVTHVASLDQALSALHATGLHTIFGLERTYRLDLASGADIPQVVARLRSDPAVEYAEPDYQARLTSAPDDPRYAEQWGLSKIQAEGAWAQTEGSPTIIIAIIDSGIDLTHPDLAPNLWVNPGEIPANGVDDDNNGLVDDVNGWNFVDGSNDVQDAIGHGSLVAGVAAARIDNGIGIAGACGLCRILPVKVTQTSGFANYSDIAAGINYAVAKGARVINLSVGGYSDSQAVHDAVDNALSHNVVVVAGAGNDALSTPFYPAAYAGVIAVAGSDSGDLRVASSNYGPWVTLSAPGQDILSTTLGDYSSGSGTSYASPFVAGTAGLLLSLHPDWTPAMLRAQLIHTADAIDSLNPGFKGQLGAGRLNAASAMQPSHPLLSYISYSGNGTPNLRPDSGSSVSLSLTLVNDWADASEVSGVLSSSDPLVTVTTPAASFGTILAGQSQANPIPLAFDIAAGAGYNHAMPFTLQVSANGGAYSTTLNFTITTCSSEQTIPAMTITTDTLWTSDKIYKITGMVGIAPGATLTIQPGTVVKFAGNYPLNVGGMLFARGTADQPILFEPYSVGGSWDRIFFDDPSTDAQATADGTYQGGNILQYVTVSGAANGIACTNATPYLDHLTTTGGGMSCSLGSTSLWLRDSTLVGALAITQGSGNLLRDSVSGGEASLPPAKVADSTFTGGLTIQGDGQVTNTTLSSLTVAGVGNIQHVTAGSGGISIASGQVLNSMIISGGITAGSASTISDCTINGGGITAGAGSMLNHNNLENSPADGITTSGASTVTFNRVVGSAGRGIVTDGGVVENNLVANTTGDGLHSATASVQNNTFTGIQGNAVYLSSMPAAFDGNNFEFNPGAYDVYVAVPATQAATLNAENNWWGTTDSSVISLRTYDFYDGDYNLAKLITSPVLTAPSQTAPAYVRSVTLNPPSPVGIQSVDFTVQFSRPMDIASEPQVTFKSPIEDTWAEKSGMPTGRGNLGVAAASNGKIYAMGGFYYGLDWEFVATVEEYDPFTNIWKTKTSMPTARDGLGVAAASNGKIYAIGGENDLGVLATVEEYDPTTDSWTTKASMPTARTYLGVVAASNGKIYAIGGHDGSYKSLSTVEEYDPTTDTWTTKTGMPTARGGLGVACANNGMIYAVGGEGLATMAIVEEYDPIMDTWTTKASLPHAYVDMGVAAASNGKIYAIGGDNGGNSFQTIVEEYDPITDAWTTKASMPTARSNLGVVADNYGRIFAIGGVMNGGGLGFITDSDSVEEYMPTDWGLAYVTSNPEWLDPTHYRASYDFSVLNAKGSYQINIEGIAGSDGMLIAQDTRTSFTLDYAGEISDITPPAAPHVLAWGNGSLTQLTARTTASDAQSAITGYRYAIGTTPGGTDVVNWTNTASPEITRMGLLLQPGQTYYISFKARNAAGLWSPAGVSNGVINGKALLLFLPVIHH